MNRCYFGDCRDSMRQLIDDGVSVQMCVTSPPYFGLRDYNHPGQLGLEGSIEEYLDNQIEVFRLVRELLADDGTLWLNMGDSYAQTGGPGWQGKNGQRANRQFTLTRDTVAMRDIARRPPEGLKPKDLLGMPWRLAFALQADGWYLRQDLVWHKPNPMPESVKDRCTKAHEYLFLLSKSQRYYFDTEANHEPVTGGAHARGNGVNPKADTLAGWDTGPGSHKGLAGSSVVTDLVDDRNRRSVWTIPTQPFEGAHFATFPEALVEPCILAGSRPDDIVLDPYFGSGTTGQVAQRLGRQWLGCEINPAYEQLQQQRTAQHALDLAEDSNE